MQRYMFLALGFLFLGIGVVGAFLPLLPTTIFLIAAAAFFARSSPRMEAYLLNHNTFGPLIHNWRTDRVIPLRAKFLAVAGMTAGFIYYVFSQQPSWTLTIIVAVILLGCAAYVVSRPSSAKSITQQ